MLRAGQNGWPVSKHSEESAIDRIHDKVWRRIEPIQDAAHCALFTAFLCHDIFPSRFSLAFKFPNRAYCYARIYYILYPLIAAKGPRIPAHTLVIIQGKA